MGTYGRSICGFFDVATVNNFSSVNKMMLKSLEQYFSTTVSTDGILFASLSSGAWQFFSTNISQGSVAARLGCGGY